MPVNIAKIKNFLIISLFFSCSLFLCRTFAEAIENDEKVVYIEEQLKLANGLKGRGHYALAIEEYQKIIKRFPDDMLSADAWYGFAETLYFAGRFDESIKTYEVFLSKFPDIKTSDSARCDYAIALGSSENTERVSKALAILNEIAYNPQKPANIREKALYNSAIIHKKNGKIAESEKIFSELASRDIGSPSDFYRIYARINLAELILEKEPGKAMKMLKSISDNKSSGQDAIQSVLLIELKIHEKNKDYASASDICSKIYENSRQSEIGKKALLSRLNFLFSNADYDKIITETDTMLDEILPEDRSYALFIKASSLEQKGFSAEATNILKAIISSDADINLKADALIEFITILIAEKKIPEAIAEIQKFLSD